jgi:peptide/nickel transport system substrate-binding protein
VLRAVAGGEVVVAYPYQPTTLNPFVDGGEAPATRDLVRPLMPSLYRLGPGGKRALSLLEREPAGPDVGGSPFAVRLRLREDAVWSDGQPITAGDLRFTWQAVMSTPEAASRDGYDRIADVVGESDKVVRLVFKQPFARWRDLFSAGLGVLPSHALGKTNIASALHASWPVSGGPYLLKTWTPGLEMVFERNPKAWGERPLLDRIRVQFVPDPITALQLYRQGKVDVIAPYAGVDMERRVQGARDGSTVTSDRGDTWAGLFLDVRDGPLADVRVRRALALGVNRAAIVDGLVRSEGELLDAPSAGDPGRTDPSFTRYAYSASEAESRLAEAGWSQPSDETEPRRRGGRDLTFTVASVGTDEVIGRVLRAMNTQAAAVGFDLNLVQLDSETLWDTWLDGSRFEAAVLIVRDPPGGGLRARFGLGGRENVSRLADTRLRGLLDAADATLDDDAAAVDEPFGRVAELVPVIPLFKLDAVTAARAGVHEVAASAAADGFMWNCDRWWIEGGARVSPSAS